jgi:hypothetical protein
MALDAGRGERMLLPLSEPGLGGRSASHNAYDCCSSANPWHDCTWPASFSTRGSVRRITWQGEPQELVWLWLHQLFLTGGYEMHVHLRQPERLMRSSLACLRELCQDGR